MIEPWNDKTILPPPLNTFYCSRYLDTNILKSTCEGIIKVLINQSPLHKECAALSRFIYKFDKKFRSDIGYRKFKLINTCLRKYLSLNFMKDVETFLSVIPCQTKDMYMPTSQMLEYVLVRLITFAKLMLKTYITLKQAAIFYLDRLKRGESYWMSFMPYALLSRIWSMVTVLQKHSCRWYVQLYEFLPQLEIKGILFLKDGLQLPSNLDDMLNMNDIDDFGRLHWSKAKVIEVIPIFNEDDDESGFDLFKYIQNLNNTVSNDIEGENKEELIEQVESNIIDCSVKAQTISRNSLLSSGSKRKLEDMVNEKNNDPLHYDINLKKGSHSSLIGSFDKGETISRKTYKSLTSESKLKKCKTNETDQSSDSNIIQSVSDAHSLKSFVKKEEELRITKDLKSRSHHLSFMQWQALKLKLTNLSLLNVSNKKICKKFQLIWKKECLDYL